MTPPVSLEGERWAPVPWYPERYIVSSLGRVWNQEAGRMKVPHMLWKGSKNPRLTNSVVVRLHRVDTDYTGKHPVECHKILARLVLEAFVGPAGMGQVAQAKDGNLANAVLDNLYWGKRSYRRTAHRYALKITQAQADEIRVRAKAISHPRMKGHESLGSLGKEYGISKTMVADIRDGRSWRGSDWTPEPTAQAVRHQGNQTINESENSGIRTYDSQWRL